MDQDEGILLFSRSKESCSEVKFEVPLAAADEGLMRRRGDAPKVKMDKRLLKRLAISGEQILADSTKYSLSLVFTFISRYYSSFSLRTWMFPWRGERNEGEGGRREVKERCADRGTRDPPVAPLKPSIYDDQGWFRYNALVRIEINRVYLGLDYSKDQAGRGLRRGLAA